jgi:hypothetical protein
MLDRPHALRIAGTALGAGSHYWLLLSATGVEMRFGEPVAPDAIAMVSVYDVWSGRLAPRRAAFPVTARLSGGLPAKGQRRWRELRQLEQLIERDALSGSSRLYGWSLPLERCRSLRLRLEGRDHGRCGRARLLEGHRIVRAIGALSGKRCRVAVDLAVAVVGSEADDVADLGDWRGIDI